MVNPVLRRPQIWSALSNTVPHGPQNFMVKFFVDGLADDEFSMSDAPDIKKDSEHAFDCPMTLCHVLHPWRRWAIPLGRLLLCLRVIPIDPRLIPGDDRQHDCLSGDCWHSARDANL